MWIRKQVTENGYEEDEAEQMWIEAEEAVRAESTLPHDYLGPRRQPLRLPLNMHEYVKRENVSATQ